MIDPRLQRIVEFLNRNRGQVSRWLFGYTYPYRERLKRRDLIGAHRID